MVTRNKSQSSHRWYFLGRTSWRFLWCWFCCCSLFVVFLHSHFLFDIISHSSRDYHQVFRLILYFHPSSLQSDSQHFHFQSFRYLLTASATVLSGHRRFWPYSPSRNFGTTCFYQGFTGSRQLLSWNSQGFMLILKTQTRPICLFDSQ